jgi:hypothetical protein
VLRPKRATAAGYLLIIVGAVSLLAWVFLTLLALAVGEALNSPDAGGSGKPVNPVFYVVLALPSAFFIAETASGVLVLRRRHWALVGALIISCLAISVATAAVVALMFTTSAFSAPSSPVSFVFPVIYAGVHILMVSLLASNDTRRWWQRP